ncbi:ROK family protein [Micromonospora halotolerans]|uniref:ROK family protein n=1 Tax=Micromonospora halotolerans TaxID=709879 RepID=A0ABY9ZWK2_9ACTN|nr:ROK family protein [Micromonospora halotolerans]WNM38955.1 ROK family protein [Micromonospora halotolerans]
MTQPEGQSVLAVDVGGTTIKGAVVGEDGRRRHTLTAPSRADDDPVKAVRSLCLQLRDDALDLGAAPAAIGVVTPGLVDETNGVVRYAANLRFRDVPLRALVGDDLGLPVAVGHDARAAGVAEAVAGAARGLDNFLLLPLGTGIAAAVVVHGEPVPGATGSAGEVGHMPVHPGGEPCSCGQRGCLEVYASAGGLARRYARLGGTPDSDSRAIADAVATDPVAATVWNDATQALGIALATLTLTLDPARIVLGGGLADAGALFFDPVRDALRAALAWRTPPPVLRSAFGAQAAQVGAAVLARRLAGLPVPDGWGAPEPGDETVPR